MSITTKYDPDFVIGEWGWLWLETSLGMEWVLCRTATDVRGAHVEIYPEDGDEYLPAKCFFGTPYMPLLSPSCEPGAALEVQMLIEPGASIRMAYMADGARVEKVKTDVMAVLMGDKGTDE